MRLLLFHPGAAGIDCEDCRQFIYDLETGQRKTFRSGPLREEKPCTRPPGVPPPCPSCPKKSPQEAARSRLTPRNRQTLDAFLECRAAGGVLEGWREDCLLMRNFAILHQLYEERDRQRLALELAGQFALLWSGK